MRNCPDVKCGDVVGKVPCVVVAGSPEYLPSWLKYQPV
jgi:hypothetical protein